MSERIPRKPAKPFEKERAFHDDRWARKETRRGLFSAKTKDDFMREEALRDDEDFEKKFVRESRKEYEVWESHCKPVRAKFLERARNPERTDIVTVAVFWPGGMRAPGIAGRVLAWDEMGINSDTVDYVVGASSGDTVATRFVGGREEILRGIGMLEGPLADKRFINVLRPGNAIDINYIKQLEESGEYALDVERIKKAHSKLWTIVTEPIQGNDEPRVRIIDKKQIKEGISTGTVATMSIPGVTGKIPQIDGAIYFDGGFAPAPIKEIIEKIRAEKPEAKIHMLILAQASFDAIANMKPSPGEGLTAKVMRGATVPLKGLGSADAAATVNQLARGLELKESLRKSLEAIEKETGADIGVIWAPPSTLNLTSIDADEMKMASSQAYRDTFELFEVPQPDEMPEYISEKQKLKDAISKFTDAA